MTTLPTNIELPTPEELRQDVLDDIVLVSLQTGREEPDVAEGSDDYVTATAVTNSAGLALAHVRRAEGDQDVLNATGDALDDIREREGLPEVPAGAGGGKLTIASSGTTSLPAGSEFLDPSGNRGQVPAAAVNLSNGDTVDAIMLTTGEVSNLETGTVVRWVSPPVNMFAEATVAAPGFTGGTDDETDARKRERILNKRRNPPGGGNWSQLRKDALDSTSSISDAVVYPALGGPSTTKIVCVGPLASPSYSRVVSQSVLDTVRAAVDAAVPDENKRVYQTATEETSDVLLSFRLDDAQWSASTVAATWPKRKADGSAVTVTSVTDSVTIRVDAETAPPAGAKIVWWSSAKMQFVESSVASHSGSSGAYDLVLDTPLEAESQAVVAGEWIGPAALSSVAYGTTWRTAMAALGPGENTVLGALLPRASRRPTVAQGGSTSDLDSTQITALQAAHTEIRAASYLSISRATPTVPVLVRTAPNVLVPRHFAIYPQ